MLESILFFMLKTRITSAIALYTKNVQLLQWKHGQMLQYSKNGYLHVLYVGIPTGFPIGKNYTEMIKQLLAQ